MNTNQKDTPCCDICKKSNVRVYRQKGNYYRPEDNRCNAHLTVDDTKYYIPCIIDVDGIPWELTSILLSQFQAQWA